jgi:hypothetical protein
MAKSKFVRALAPLVVLAALVAGCKKKPPQYKKQPRISTVVTYDSQGRRILAGSFLGDLKVGDEGIKATDGVDAYVAVYGRDNKVLWRKHFSGPDHQTATGVVVDKQDNIIVVGMFRGNLTIEKESREKGFIGLKSEPGKRYGIYVIKLRPDGQVEWNLPLARQATETQVSVAIRPDGRIAVGGNFIGFVELNGQAVIPKNSQSMFTANVGPDGKPGDYFTQTIASDFIVYDCPHAPHEEGPCMPKQCHPHGHCVGTVCDDPLFAYCCQRYDDPAHAWDGDCVTAARNKC